MFRAGVKLPIQRTGSSGRGVWKRGSGGWRGGCTGSLRKTKNLVMVCDEELHKYSLVAGL